MYVHGEMSQCVYMADDDLMCLLPCSDLTIISGDSRGKTSFWNGKQGTRITVGGTAVCQCTSSRIGWMWSDFLALHTSLAAAF